MVTKIAPNGFAETRDHMAWVMGYAPNFPRRLTLDDVFADLNYGLDTVKVTLKDAERLEILERCRGMLADAKAALAKNEIIPGKQLLLDAQYLFRSLRRPKRKPGQFDPGDSAEDTVDD